MTGFELKDSTLAAFEANHTGVRGTLYLFVIARTFDSLADG